MPKKTKDAADALRQAIRQARKDDARLTMYRVAQIAGIAQETLSRFMSGKRDIRFSNVVKIMAVLNLEITKK